MKALVTAFEPFGGDSFNVSEAVLRLIPGQTETLTVEKLTLPVVFGGAAERLCRKIEETLPDIVLCLGQAAGRKAITIEKYAHNIRRAAIPDNEGNLPLNAPVKAGKSPRLEAALPLEALLKAVSACGTEAYISENAGEYVCNDLLYSLLDFREANNRSPTYAGFIHLPVNIYTNGALAESVISALCEAARMLALSRKAD